VTPLASSHGRRPTLQGSYRRPVSSERSRREVEGFDRAGVLPDDARQRLLALVRGLRSGMHDHLAVTCSQLLAAESLADSEPLATMQSPILTVFTELGLGSTELLVHYRSVESLVLDASVFDFGSAPAHLESRRQRLRHVTDRAFEAATRDKGSIDELNDAAFDRVLVLIVDECARVGAVAITDRSARPGQRLRCGCSVGEMPWTQESHQW